MKERGKMTREEIDFIKQDFILNCEMFGENSRIHQAMKKAMELIEEIEVAQIKIEHEMVEPIDCEDCAFNSGLSVALDIVNNITDAKGDDE